MASYLARGRKRRSGRLATRGGWENPRPETYPIPFAPYIQAGGEVEKVPIMLFSIRWLYDITYASDVLRTIIRTITGETFKNGLDIKEKFKSLCLHCHRQFEEDIMICPYDGSLTRPPDYSEYIRLKEFIDQGGNKFGEKPLEVLKEVDNDVNITDNGYIFLRKDYYYDENGAIIGADILEIMRLSPEKMRIVMSAHGGARGENGEHYFFCPIHRKELIAIPDNDETVPRCQVCDGQTLEAWFGAREEERPIYFGKDEVYHIKRWSHTQGYGVPPMYSIYLKVLALLKMDRFVVNAYSLQRSPQGLLVIKGRVENLRKAWMELMQKARENPYMIYPLVVEGEEDTKRIVEYQEFSLKPVDFLWVESRKEYRETIGAVYGVQPIFVQGAQGQGLSNEGLMITVTAQTINEQQRVWEIFFDWLSHLLGAYDYHIVMNRNELEDELKRLDIADRRLELAKNVAALGFSIRIRKDSNGILDFDYVRENDGDAVQEERDTPPSKDVPPPKAEGTKSKKKDDSLGSVQNNENKVNTPGFGN